MRVAKFKIGDEELEIPVPPHGTDQDAQRIANGFGAKPKLQGFHQVPFAFSGEGKIPYRRSSRSSAWKLYTNKEETLIAGELTAIDTGVHLQLPPGYAGLLIGTARATEKGIIVCPGLIDGENDQTIYIRATAAGDKPVVVKKGSLISQVVIIRIAELPLQLGG